MRREHALLVSVALFAAACEIAPGSVPIEVTGDRDDWATHVQPYVAIRCGTLDCHGDPGRPFRVYAEEGLRIGSDREAMLTDREIDENVASAIGVGPHDDIASHPLLMEPLDPGAGGWDHVGLAVWYGQDEPGYLCLRGWLEGADIGADCAMATAEVPRGAVPP